MKLKNKTILLVSPNKWGDMHISKHHYARALAKRGNKVFFLNPPNLNSKLFKKSYIEENLTVIDYYPLFRGKRIFPSDWYNFLIRFQIKFIQRKIGRIDILWSFTSTIFFD